MIIRTVIALTAILTTGAAAAADCPADFNFVAPQGHDARMKSIGGLMGMFKGSKANDKAMFMAAAADPYIQHSPDLADAMAKV